MATPAGALDAEFLLREILKYYADDQFSRVSFSGEHTLVRDYRIAKQAINESNLGKLLVVLCNAHRIPMMELARKAQVPESRMGLISSGKEITEAESVAFRKALEDG